MLSTGPSICQPARTSCRKRPSANWCSAAGLARQHCATRRNLLDPTDGYLLDSLWGWVTSDVTTAWDRGDTFVTRRLQDPNAERGPVENNLHRICTHFLGCLCFTFLWQCANRCVTIHISYHPSCSLFILYEVNENSYKGIRDLI